MSSTDLAMRPSRHPGSGGVWFIALVTLFLGLAGCSGGGGGVASPVAPNVLKVTVTDTFGAMVPGATVQGPRGTASTDVRGSVLLLLDSTERSASITVSRTAFIDKTVVTPIVAGQLNEVTVTVDRMRAAAGGSLGSRSGVLPVADNSAQQLTFEIELVVVDGESRPIENLTAANFMLRPCTPDATSQRNDCVYGAGPDAAYAPGTAAPEAVQMIPGGTAVPYAATLLLDQSGSITQSDPTGARLFSAKAFLSGLGADDHALLAAFAGGPGAVIPTPPLALYAPFKDRASALAYFPTLDSLSLLVGGNTPLYESLDALRQQSMTDASLPAGLAKAVVIFTDGADTSCSTEDACRTMREQSIQGANAAQVRLFTIGLSSSVDIVALGELANKTGGALLYADNAEQLLPLYGSVGRLLSLSLPTYRLRWTVQANAGTFVSGNTLLGRVQVTAQSGTFDVPFVVGIP
jgi:hypothetical protein